MRTPVFNVDRAKLNGLADLADIIERHLDNGEIVHVLDGGWPDGERLRYTLQWAEGATRAFDGLGRPLGVFADLDALIRHAERMTA